MVAAWSTSVSTYLSGLIGVLSKRNLRLGSFRPLCLWNKYGWMNLNIFLSPPNFHPCVDGKLLLHHKKFISTRRYIHSSWSNNVSRLGRRHRLLGDRTVSIILETASNFNGSIYISAVLALQLMGHMGDYDYW